METDSKRGLTVAACALSHALACVRSFALSCAILCAFGIGSAHAADKLRLIVAGIDKQIYLPVTLAARLGYFKAQDLEVDLVTEASGVRAEDELLAGGAQGVVGFYDHTISLQAKGKFVLSVVQFSRAPGEVQVVSNKLAQALRTPADFKGRRLGVTGLGSSTHLLQLYLGISHGLRAADMTMVPVGSGASFIAAMRQGSIDTGMNTEPTVSLLLKSGEARMLVDLRTPQSTAAVLGGLYPGACLYMSTQWVNGHKPQVQKLANALVLALRYIGQHSAEEIAAQMPVEFFAGDRALYVDALRHSQATFTPDGVMPAGGPATVLKVLQAADRVVQSKTIDLSKTYTTEFALAVP